MTLTKATDGVKTKITSLEATHALRGKLAAMGIVPGSEIEVVRGAFHGAYIIRCRGAEFVLGRGLAHLIHVEG
ncbi:MAG: FeoA family protein [Planctomycetia bacterium]|nr:FeoA family protein [Planctomycetia bacterium]